MIDELHYDAATKVLLEFKTRFWEQGPGGFTGGGCVSDSASRFAYFPSHVPGSPGGGRPPLTHPAAGIHRTTGLLASLNRGPTIS